MVLLPLKLKQGPGHSITALAWASAEEFSTRLIDWSPFVIMGNTVPPRVPDEDEEDEEDEEAE